VIQTHKQVVLGVFPEDRSAASGWILYGRLSAAIGDGHIMGGRYLMFLCSECGAA